MASRALPTEDQFEPDNDVTAAALTRRQGHYFQLATTRPLAISHHGRVSHFLIGSERFAELVASTGRSDMGEARRLLRLVADRMVQSFMWLDQDMNVRLMNAQAAAHFGVDPDVVVGDNLLTIVPQLCETLFYSRARATVALGEIHSADVPSLVYPAQWMQFTTFPLDGGVGVTMRNITDDIRDNRQADVKDAILLALREHGEIGYARLNLRGIIDRADHVLSTFVRLAEDRLTSIPFVDLITRGSRVAVRDAIDRVLSVGEGQRLEADLLANDGAIVSVRLAIAPLKRQLGIEGAVVVVSRC